MQIFLLFSFCHLPFCCLWVSCARDFHERVSIRKVPAFVRFQKLYSGSSLPNSVFARTFMCASLSLYRYPVITLFRFLCSAHIQCMSITSGLYPSPIASMHRALMHDCLLSLAIYIVLRCAVSILSIMGDGIPAALSILPDNIRRM